MRSSRRGFTIVELLVVVAIIVILAALVMPVIKRIKVTTAMGLCATNQQDLYEVQEVYMASHGYKIPPVSAYKRGQGCISGYVGRWAGDDPYHLFFAGYYAKHGYIDEGTALICPDTTYKIPWNGSSHALNTISRLGMMSPRDWAEDPRDTIFGNYGLRWSGRKDKTYPDERLMFAETSACFPHGPMTDEITYMHGGRFIRGDDSTAPSMNITTSTGRIMGLHRYTDTRLWLWAERYYYPHNERTGDVMVAPCAIDETDVSDGGWGFWQSFDGELFDQFRWPWGGTIDEKPDGW